MKKNFASKYVDSISNSISNSLSSISDAFRSHKEKRSKGGHVEVNPFLEKERSMVLTRLPGYFLIFSILGVLYLLYLAIQPFFTTLLVAAVLTVLFYGVYKWFRNLFGRFHSVASILTCVLVVLVIIVPLALFIFLIAREAIDMYQNISGKIASGSLDALFKWDNSQWFLDLKHKLAPIVNLDSIDFKQMILSAAQTVSTFLVEQSAAILKNLGSFLVNFIIMLFSMFYLFKDGDKFLQKLSVLSPLPKKYEDKIYSRLKDTIYAIAFGVFLTAIIQGILAGVGYVIVGLPNPVFWATATGFFSMIPMIGTGTIWFPAAIILFVTGNYAGGIFLLIWGFCLVSVIDNFISPYLIGTKSKMYPLLTFFVIVGGIVTFGLNGLIFGPLILVLFLTLLHVYELEYKKVLNT
jgi:predicted PurR-regulated permease PerM